MYSYTIANATILLLKQLDYAKHALNGNSRGNLDCLFNRGVRLKEVLAPS